MAHVAVNRAGRAHWTQPPTFPSRTAWNAASPVRSGLNITKRSMISPRSIVCSTPLAHGTIKVRAMPAWTVRGCSAGSSVRLRSVQNRGIGLPPQSYRRFWAGAGRPMVAMTTRPECCYRHSRCCRPAPVITPIRERQEHRRWPAPFWGIWLIPGTLPKTLRLAQDDRPHKEGCHGKARPWSRQGPRIGREGAR